MRVLVADTDAIWVKKLSDEAEKRSMIVECAGNGLEVIKRIRRGVLRSRHIGASASPGDIKAEPG